MGDSGLKIFGGLSFHDWLVESSYVNGLDDDKRKHLKKKRIVHKKNNHLDSVDSRNPVSSNGMFASDENAFQALGKRKSQRMKNDRLLRDLAGPLDASDIASLYAPPPWGDEKVESVFYNLTDSSSNLSFWEPFRNVDMDAQETYLSREGRVKEKKSKEKKKGGEERVLAMAAWKSVEKCLRNFLKKCYNYDTFNEYENILFTFLDENYVNENKELCEEIRFPLSISFHRLIIHGLCQFHGLKSFTLHDVITEDGEAMPMMVIKKTKSKNKNHQHHNMRLSEFLSRANNNNNNNNDDEDDVII